MMITYHYIYLMVHISNSVGEMFLDLLSGHLHYASVRLAVFELCELSDDIYDIKLSIIPFKK